MTSSTSTVVTTPTTSLPDVTASLGLLLTTEAFNWTLQLQNETSQEFLNIQNVFCSEVRRTCAHVKVLCIEKGHTLIKLDHIRRLYNRSLIKFAFFIFQIELLFQNSSVDVQSCRANSMRYDLSSVKQNSNCAWYGCQFSLCHN